MANLDRRFADASAAQIKHMAKPLWHPNQASGVCETGLTHEYSKLQSHLCFQNLQGPQLDTFNGYW